MSEERLELSDVRRLMRENMGVSPPTASTLNRYGLSADEWWQLLDSQDGVCPICDRVPNLSAKTGKVRFVIDHEHVRGWKNMPPEKRKLYVRGLTCWFCNHSFLGRGITIDKAERVAEYLSRYAQRRPK